MMSSAEAMRPGLPKSFSHGRTASGRRRLETEKPVSPALGLDATAGRALVADLAARAGGGAGVGRDGGRVVVGLDLHQDADGLAVEVVDAGLRDPGRSVRPPVPR